MNDEHPGGSGRGGGGGGGIGTGCKDVNSVAGGKPQLQPSGGGVGRGPGGGGGRVGS